jgi:hypothetical protein
VASLKNGWRKADGGWQNDPIPFNPKLPKGTRITRIQFAELAESVVDSGVCSWLSKFRLFGPYGATPRA